MPAEHSLSRLTALEERRGSLLRAALERVLGDGDVPPPVSFEDGLQTLPRALYRAHEAAVHLDTPVERVRDADDGDGYVVEAGDRTAPVDRVLVTVPARAAAAVLEDLRDATVAPLADLTYNPLVLVFLRAGLDDEAFGYQVRRNEPLETLGVTWNDSLFDRDGVHTAFLGGMEDPGAVDRSDEELGAVAREEFADVTGVSPAVLSVRRLPRALPAYDATWSGLDDVELPDGVDLVTNYTGRLGVPGRLRAAARAAEDVAAVRTPAPAAGR